jgi:hypothetical protein
VQKGANSFEELDVLASMQDKEKGQRQSKMQVAQTAAQK